MIAAPSLMPQKIARLLEQTLDEEEFAWKDLPSIESIEKVIQGCLDGKITADQAAARPVRGAVGNLRQGAGGFWGTSDR